MNYSMSRIMASSFGSRNNLSLICLPKKQSVNDIETKNRGTWTEFTYLDHTATQLIKKKDHIATRDLFCVVLPRATI